MVVGKAHAAECNERLLNGVGMDLHIPNRRLDLLAAFKSHSDPRKH
jgi:hypothetical protein